jgi:hypothetical protein
MKILLAILLSICSVAQAQKARVETHFLSEDVLIDGKSMKRGLRSYYDIADAMKGNSKAYQFAQTHEELGRKADWWLWGGLGVALTYLFSTSREDYSSSIYWGIFGVGFVGHIYYMAESRNYLHKAVNAYNGVPVTRNPQIKVDLFSYNF